MGLPVGAFALRRVVLVIAGCYLSSGIKADARASQTGERGCHKEARSRLLIFFSRLRFTEMYSLNLYFPMISMDA